jgi:hypothetical protein
MHVSGHMHGRGGLYAGRKPTCTKPSRRMYRVTVAMRQHCTDGSFRFCRWRAHTEAFSEDSGPEALSTQGQYFALQVFYEILEHIAGELSSNCCRTITMTRYSMWAISDITVHSVAQRFGIDAA